MTNKPKNKAKNSSSSLLREAKPKNRLGLKVPQLRMPHEELISPPATSEREVESSLTRQTRQTSFLEPGSPANKDLNFQMHSNPPIQEKTANLTLAPTRNYQKVPNSLTKEAIPAGLFKGKSKQLYDILYSLTRGAINASRSVRISKSKLMKLAGIGSRITFDSNVRHLKLVGLIEETVYIGEHEGNEFEVFLPEEAIQTIPSQTTLPSQTSSPQKQDTLVILETSHTRHSLNDANTDSYEASKTSLKTFKTIDDEKKSVFEGFIKEFEKISKKLTGQGLRKAESPKWTEIAKLLIMELELAAARTESVSSVPAFLKEVLRRKLESKTNSSPVPRKATSKGVSQSLQVGKPLATAEPSQAAVAETWEKELLTNEEKQKTLQVMRERIEEGHRELVMSMKPVFAEEDWIWLMKKLPKEIGF
jgi:hypothetical protein